MDDIDKKIKKAAGLFAALRLEMVIQDAQIGQATAIVGEWLIAELKKCREENNALRIINEALNNFNKAIEQRTKEGIKQKIHEDCLIYVLQGPLGNRGEWFKVSDVYQAIDGAKGE